jgi:hypothetical protein
VREQLAGATAAVTAATAAASGTDGSNAAAAAAAAAEVVQLQGLLAERDAQMEDLQAQVRYIHLWSASWGIRQNGNAGMCPLCPPIATSHPPTTTVAPKTIA